MNSLISKLWNLKNWVYILLLGTAISFSNYFLTKMQLNGLQYNQLPFYSQSIDINMGMGIAIKIFMSLFISLITYVLISIYYRLFVRLYARSFGGRLAVVNELPLDKLSFIKYVFMFMILAHIVVGLIRVIYFFNPLLITIIESIAVPIVYALVAILAFYVMRKYILQGKIGYNVFIALAIPYVAYYIAVI